MPLSRFLIFAFIAFNFSTALHAQRTAPPPPPPLPQLRAAMKTVAADEKGSLVRGRAVFEDTGKAVRRAWIGFVKIRDLVEKKSENVNEIYAVGVAGGDSFGADKYVLTDDEGTFVIKNIKAGVYQATIKMAGILNPSFADRKSDLFQQFAVDGTSDAQVFVSAKRGGALGGKILYSDGEPVVGAKVQVIKKAERINEVYPYAGDNITVAVTDDRGVYRFSGLPAAEYLVRVTEPSVHSDAGDAVSGYNLSQYGSNSELKTFYPAASEAKDARAVSVAPGQEQTEININIPDRRLFRISGTVVAKNDKMPLKNIRISFQKISDNQSPGYDYNQSKQVGTNEQGSWSFKDLPKGKYRLSAQKDENYAYTEDGKRKSLEEPKYATVTKEIEIGDAEPGSVIFELPLEATISGFITTDAAGKAVTGFVYMMAFDEEKKINGSSYSNGTDAGGGAAQTDKTSRPFRIGRLAEGKYFISAGTSHDFYVKSIRLGNQDLMNSPLALEDGQNIEGVQIVLGTDVGTVKGKVANFKSGDGGRSFVVLIPTGKPVSVALRSSRQGFVNQAGEFQIKAAPGEYFVAFLNQNNPPKPDKFEEWFKEATKNAEKVTVKAGETTSVSVGAPQP